MAEISFSRIEGEIKVRIRKQGEPNRIKKVISDQEKTVRKAFRELTEEQLIKV